MASEYHIVSLDDVSTGVARRYRANIVLSDDMPRSEAIARISHAVRAIRGTQVFRHTGSRKLWAPRWPVKAKPHPVDIVILFAYLHVDDIPHAKWACRCLWVSPDLDARFRPLPIREDDVRDGIVIEWRRVR